MNNKLKKFMCLILTFILAFTLSGELPAIADSGETIISVPITVQEEYDLANDFFTLLNQKRAEAGLPQYKLDAGLMEMAMQRGAQLCVYFGHNSLYSSNAAVTDLRKGTPIEKTVNVTEDIAEGLANASSAYTVWYDSLGHRPALISTDYNYCGIGVVTYEGKREWSLIVSQYPCGNTIDGVSGTKTNTRTINAYPKYFGKGAKIYAEIAGYGATCDGYHMTSPAPDGLAAGMAMTLAMQEAGVTPSEVNYINAHGTSTGLNDKYETTAIKNAFGDEAYNVKVNSTKSMIGHLLGAAGAVEAIVTAKTIAEGFIHKTVGYKVKDEECDLNVCGGGNIEQEVKAALSNSLGFGGHNATICLKKFSD